MTGDPAVGIWGILGFLAPILLWSLLQGLDVGFAEFSGVFEVR